ncbi:universal stress protein [Streptosporangium carneum]|uniref:Universal stress protein n=1 Tax=Streptosporangium carneum TaxID=47481 RepID=A0A9W6MAU5_9ACTN|nr:universal stress protein [Streptosporangium carneum]GLK07674.1 universal stress protein [Streptosporangium carneum]
MIESIVVGTDGSPAATVAVSWAVDDAGRRRLPVRIVHVVEHWPYGISAFPPPGWQEAMTHAGEQVIAEAAKTAAGRRPDVDATTALIGGTPLEILREQASEATELVIGSRGLGGFTEALLGSAVLRLAGHVPGAVVVVKAEESERRGEVGEVLVGVDGSPAGEPAVGFAFEQARLRGCPLRALRAWQVPPHAFMPDIVDVAGIRQEQQQMIDSWLAPWVERFPEVRVVPEVTCANPASVLTEASAQADLLVVGSRGLGAVGSMVLGSVSRGVLPHARCPVAVVRS